MAYEKVYSRINWENEPSTKSPINEENLNKMDFALNEIDNRTVELSGYESVVIDYSNQAKTSAANALSSETKAKTSEQNAYSYEQSALTSKNQAEVFKNEAETHANNASDSERNAKLSEDNASASELLAKNSEENASGFATSAFRSSENASGFAESAKTSAQNAKASEDISVASASNAKTYSDLAKSYTVGTHGEVRENDDTDNAKYYYEQTKSFVTGSVTGIKGEAEKEFRYGNVIITKGNLGLGNVENKSAQEIISEIGNATESSDGLMSKEDKVKLDGISDIPIDASMIPYRDNKSVADELVELKNDLDGLGYGENGAKNLFEDEIKWMENIDVARGTKSVSDGKITLTATDNDCYTIHDANTWKNNGIKTIPCKPNTKYTFSWEHEGDAVGNVYVFENGSTNNMSYDTSKAHKLLITTSADAEYLTVRVGVFNPGTSITYWNFQLEEGDTATPYEPYIPSVKMLAEEVDNVNDSLGDYGLNNKATPLKQGGYKVEDGTYENVGYWVCTSEMIPCKKGDTITVKSQYRKTHAYIMVRYYNASKQFIGTTWNENSNTYTTTCSFDNVAYCNVNFQEAYDGQGITPSEVVVSVYVNNAIDEIKNDLGGLSFSVSGTTLSITDGTNTWTLSN